jgi:hypothetical protein
VVSARGAEPRGRVNFLHPTSNTIPSPLLSPGEACSTKFVREWPHLNSCSCLVQSKGTPTGAYLAHPSIKVKAKARNQVHDSFSLKLVTLNYLSSRSIFFVRHRLDTVVDIPSDTLMAIHGPHHPRWPDPQDQGVHRKATRCTRHCNSTKSNTLLVTLVL